MRILLDTNVLARAASGPPSLANELVTAATEPQHTLLLSPFLLAELSRVLRYDRLQRAPRQRQSAWRLSVLA
jgi:predicted nucleic acid-binding protein